MLVVLAIIIVGVIGVLAFYRPGLGLIAGIVLSIVLLLFGIAFEQVELVFTSPFVFLLSIVVVGFGPSSQKQSWPRVWARRILIFCGLVVFVTAGFAMFGIGGSFGLFFVLIFVGGTVGIFASSELARASFVISTIGSSMKQNLPLPMALEMASAGRNDKRGDILRDIKKWLVEGYPLSESLKRGYPRCPAYVTGLVAAGERIGQVPQAIAALEQDLVAKANTSRKVRHIPSFYPPIVLFVMFVVVFFLMVFVIPKFSAVLKEMGEGVPMPAATRILIEIAEFFRSKAAGVIGLLLVLAALVGGIVYIRVKARPRRPEKPYLISRIGDFIKWRLPFLGWYEWSRAMQRVVGMLRLSLNAGCTINESIASTLRLDVNESFRKRLKLWLASVEQGNDIGQSAGQCGLGSGLTWAFCDIDNHSNTLAILDTLETSYRWAYSRAATLARFIIGPCETICLGLIVGFVLYAVFVSLVAIIIAAGSIIP